MKIITYTCEKCFKSIIFKENDVIKSCFCPKCGNEMRYWCTEEIDPTTNKVVNRYREPERASQNTVKPISSEFSHLNPPTITCPYCQSTNTKKISGLSKAGSVALWGVFALGKTTKQWHCNDCGSDF